MICKKCNIDKDLSNFPKAKDCISGYRGTCKDCKSIYMVEYRKKNKDVIDDQRAEYRNLNREKINREAREYRANNISKVRNINKENYLKNREELLDKRKEYNFIHRDELKLRREQNPDKWDAYKKTEKYKIIQINHSSKRRIQKKSTDDGTVTADFLQQLANDTKYCIFMGVELTPENRHLDHILPLSRGGLHTTSNVRFISAEANMMKNKKTDEEFIPMFRLYMNTKKTNKNLNIIN